MMAKKEAAEKRLRAELAKNAAKQKELGDAWDTIEKSVEVARQLDAERNFIANAAGLNSTLFTQARQHGARGLQPAGGRAGGRGAARQRGGGAAPAAGGARRAARRRRRRPSTSRARRST